MTEEYYNYSQYIKFVLGYAGTGKSTLLAEEANDTTVVLTPTHKAKEVLERKGVKNVYTIHSVLKLVPTLDMNFRKKGKMQRLKRMGAVELDTIDKIIIDEFSMIPTHIMDLLLELLPEKTPVTIYGDPYQLPPVDGDPVDPEFYGREIRTLTTQYRSDAPEVIETFTRLVHYLENPDPSADLTMNPAIQHGSLDDFNPETDRALAYTNKKVIEINNMIAKKLGLPRELSIGETVLVNGIEGRIVEPTQLMAFELMIDPVLTIYPACVSKGRLMSREKMQDKIDKIEYDIGRFNQTIPDHTEYFVEIEDTTYRLMCDLDHYAVDQELKAEVEVAQLSLINFYNLEDDVDLKDWCRNNRNEHTIARGKAWSRYLAHQNLIWDIRRPFCTTVHKAQGSEFDTVYIDQENMKLAIRGNYFIQYARLMYVALSRAIKKVVII